MIERVDVDCCHGEGARGSVSGVGHQEVERGVGGHGQDGTLLSEEGVVNCRATKEEGGWAKGGGVTVFVGTLFFAVREARGFPDMDEAKQVRGDVV